MQAYGIPILLVAGMGLVFAALLTVAAKFFAVPENENVSKCRECLPGANCGACGYKGCDDYAAALGNGETTVTNLCVPGGEKAAADLAAVLGLNAMESVKKVANLRCSGTHAVTAPAVDYRGIATCKANKLSGGRSACGFGCLGFGDCVAACPYEAICISDDGIPYVNRDKCVGCGMCAKACPQKLIDILPVTARVQVACSCTLPGAAVGKACSAGCIGCGLCEKSCKFDAIHVVDKLARIDYDKCKNCGMCAKACPKHVIRVIPKASAK